MRARLLSLDGHIPTCDTNLGHLPVVVGSARDAGIRLEEQTISPRHCRIDQAGAQVVVEFEVPLAEIRVPEDDPSHQLLKDYCHWLRVCP